MKGRKRGIIRKEGPASDAELPTLTGAFKWFQTVATDERFHVVMDLLKKLKRHNPGDLQPLPHQQHYASGYDAGFNHAMNRLYSIAASPPTSEEEVDSFIELTKREDIYPKLES